jgi:hypothetical protein
VRAGFNPRPASRPGDAFGLPYNGLATNEVLTLPGGRKVDYPFSGHQAVLVEGRNKARQPPRSAAQQEFCRQQGYTFRPYALLTGPAREIGGQALGTQSWLYCDERYVWKVRLDVAKISGTNRLHLKLVLVNVFGLLSWDVAPPSMAEERVLAETVFPLRYRYIEARVSSLDCTVHCFLTHSRHGDVTAINLCSSLDEVGDCDFQTPEFGYQYGGNGYQTHTVLTARIAGNGSIATGAVGRGITGSLEILRQGGDLVEAPTEAGYEGYLNWWVYAAATTEGSIVWAKYESAYSTGYIHSLASFGGVTIEVTSNGASAYASVSHMVAPNVFILQAASGGTISQRTIVAADGPSLGDYFDAAGATARLVAYNPGSGEFAVAPTADDLVQWV